MNSLPIREPRFHTRIGAVTASVFLSLGIRALILGLSQPLIWGIIQLINYRIKTRHADMLLLASPGFYWPVEISHLANGFMAFVLALTIAFWVAKRKPSSSPAK